MFLKFGTIHKFSTFSQYISLKFTQGNYSFVVISGARCISEVRAFAHGAMGRQIDPSWRGPIELFLVPASAP